MRYKLLAVSTHSLVNIGDYIQAVAAAQFLPRVDGFIEREELRDYDGEPCRVIMNGWFIHDPSQWPPSDKIDPLFASVHFNPSARWKVFDPVSICYLKKYEPIGCRDLYTYDKLLKFDVKSKFSACLTLTLGYKYQPVAKTNQVIFVDPYFITDWTNRNIFRNAIYLATHFRAIRIISKKHPDPKTGLRKMMIVTSYYREYRKVFTDKTLLRARYIAQQSSHWKTDYQTNEERFAAAEQLVQDYANAPLVVTSRIHTAMACLGLGTPVIFTEAQQAKEAYSSQIRGLQDLFNILRWDVDHLMPDFDLTGKISSTDNIPEQKMLWKPLAEKLYNRCKSWVDMDTYNP